MMPITASYNSTSVFRNCPSSRWPASWKLRWLLIRVQHKKKKRWECRPHPLSTAEALWQWHKSVMVWEKILQRRCMPFHYCIAWMESPIHIFYVCNICCFRTTSILHVWIHSFTVQWLCAKFEDICSGVCQEGRTGGLLFFLLFFLKRYCSLRAVPFNITIVQAYAPTSDYDDNEIK